MTGSRLAFRGLVLAAVVTVAACGVPTDGQARPIATEPGTDTTSSPVTGASSGRQVILYFVGPDGLEKVTRRVESDPDPTATAIRTLLAGLTDAEKEKELLSSIPPDTRLLATPTKVDEVLTVDLSSELNGITGDSLKAAYAQIVWTAAAPTNANQVRFLIEGKPIAVPTDSENKDVVGRNDYDTLRPRNEP